MKRLVGTTLWGGLMLLAAVLGGGCSGGAPPVPPEALVVTLATNLPPGPGMAGAHAGAVAGDYGDVFYPAGSRVVLAQPARPSAQVPAANLRELSRGLYSAGGPVISHDGSRVYYSGKATATSPWQIYEADLRTGRTRPLTALPGGAISPALLPGGAMVFSSPVPKAEEVWSTSQPAALYVLKPGRPPQRITYGPKSALDPTVLRDGRILFVSALTRENASAPLSLGLFTVNSDGTEVTRFALDGDGPALVARPRELPGKRVAFLEQHTNRLALAYVSTARPFQSRKAYPAPPELHAQDFRCVEAWDAESDLVCVMPAPGPHVPPAPNAPAGIGLIAAHTARAWLNLWPGSLAGAVSTAAQELRLRSVALEAVAARPAPAPMGHVSAMSSAKKTGILLCMDANYHRDGRTRATAVRVITLKNGAEKVLGEVPLQADGSFIAEVPADTLLGFETVEGGRVAHRQPPSLWVRAGENRSCIGCHEPYNRSPRNMRPQAANLVPPVLSGVKDFSAPSATMKR